MNICDVLFAQFSKTMRIITPTMTGDVGQKIDIGVDISSPTTYSDEILPLMVTGRFMQEISAKTI